MRILTPAHHLSIEGLCSNYDIAGQIRTLVASLSFRHGAKISNIEYLSHTIARNERDNDVLRLELSFGDTDAANVMQSFCKAVMKAAHEIELERISRFGLLGFSPGSNPEFEECWNMASLHVLYVDGSETFENAQKRALSIKAYDLIPHWFKILNFVADTVIESQFSCLPSMDSCDLDSIELQRVQRKARRNEKMTSFSFWGSKVSLPIQLLQLWISVRSTGQTHEQRLGKTRESLQIYYSSVADVARLLRLCQCENGLTQERHHQIFVNVYALTGRAVNAFTQTEEMWEAYHQLMVSCSIDVTMHGILGIYRGVKAYQYFEARNAVIPEGFLTRIGRALNLVKGDTPEILRSKLGKAAFSSTLWAVVSVGQAAYSVYGIVESKQRRDYCREAASLIQQTYLAAAETVTLLRWVKCTSGSFTFVGNHGRDWEKALEVKLGRAPENDWKSADFVKIYLQDRLEELVALEAELNSKLKVVLGSDLRV